MKRVNMLDLSEQYNTMREEMLERIDEVLSSSRYILSDNVKKLEEGDEIITVSFTFFATAGAIARANAKPVFVDIDPNTYNMDVTQLEEAITDKTKAIIPVHLYGQMADMNPIMEIAKKYDLAVIE